MYNITLINTAHSELGQCNSDQLCSILENIAPEVIFEELPTKSFNNYYNGNPTCVPLEVKCIKKYLQNQNAKHIPVDIADPNRPTLERLMFEEFKTDKEYKKIKYEHNLLRKQKGFDYLNSDKCMELVEKWPLIEKRIVEAATPKDVFLATYKLFYEDVDNRENAMLQNIYNYSKGNQYSHAVFLIGCGHRKSIISKIIAYEKQRDFKLKWTFYNDQSSDLS